MTYTALTASTLVSGISDILNGVTLRASPMELRSFSVAPWGMLGITSGIPGYECPLLSAVLATCPIPERVDILVIPTLRVLFAVVGAEAAKSCKLRFAGSFAHAASTSTTSDADVDVSSADFTVGTASGDMGVVDIPLTTALWDGVTSGMIFAQIQRIAITGGGTELAGNLAILGASLIHTIER